MNDMYEHNKWAVHAEYHAALMPSSQCDLCGLHHHNADSWQGCIEQWLSVPANLVSRVPRERLRK